MSVSEILAIRLRWFVLLAVTIGMQTAQASADIFGDIEVTAVSVPKLENGSSTAVDSGYVERRFVVKNLSLSHEHQVRLALPFYEYRPSSDFLLRNSRSVRLAPGSAAVLSILRPPIAAGDGNLAVEIDGIRQERPVALYGSLGFGARASRHGNEDSQCIVLNSKEGGQTDLGLSNALYLRSELAMDEWSAQWLGYSCYNCVLLTKHEASKLPPDVALALRRYAEAGGIVLIQGASGDTNKIVPESLRSPQDELNRDGHYVVGFGLIGIPTVGKIPQPTSKEAGIPSNPDLQVVNKVDVPVRGLLLLVTFFAIAIGPVNLWLLARNQRRMWLWWIVPAVSVGTCLVILTYSLIAEGITHRVRTVALTILDEDNHRATTIGYYSCYCPLTPSGGLHFSYDTELTPLFPPDDWSGSWGPRRSGTSRTMDWTNDQHLQSGWVASRVPAMFAVRKSETSRRERLAVRTDADGKVTVVNGLGVNIKSLYYMDDKQQVHTADNLPAGQEGALSKGPHHDKAGSVELRTLLSQDWSKSLPDMRLSPTLYLQPGRYVAMIERSPFLEDGLPNARHEESWGIVYGITARSSDGR